MKKASFLTKPFFIFNFVKKYIPLLRTTNYCKTMKTLSLILEEAIYQETEQLIGKIKKPRNRYINEALQHYNKIQKRKLIEKLLVSESEIVCEESMKVLSEFENIDRQHDY